MKKKTVGLVVVFASVLSSFLLFLIPQQAQIVISDFNASGKEQKDGATALSVRLTLASQGGLLYTVDSTGDGGNVGLPSFCDDGTGHCTLRAAIQASNLHPGADGIELGLPAGSVINLPQALPDVSDSVIIFGPGANLVTVQSSLGNHRIFTITTTGPVTFSGLTIRSGGANGSGGGIANFASGTVNVINCAIRNNVAMGSVSKGGGIYNIGTLNVTNSTIEGNSSELDGGGIYNIGTLNVTNSTIFVNSAAREGGGINNTGTTNVTNSTISGNFVVGAAGGSRGGGIHNAVGTANVKSSIIAVNLASTAGPDLNGSFVSAGFNLIGKRDGSTGFTLLASDQTGTIASPLDPKLDLALRDNGGSTRTVVLLRDSPAIDKGTSVGLTGNLTTDQRGAGFTRTFDNPTIPNPAGGNGTDVGAFERQAIDFDFDGDGKADISVFRPSIGTWYLLRSQFGFLYTQFGVASDKLTPADFDGDGRTDVAVFRGSSNGTWYRLNSSTGAFFFEQFGAAGDLAMPGDFDGDGKADLAIYRPTTGEWYWKNSGSGAVFGVQFGIAGDKPLMGDFDGDGKADVALYRPSNGGWYRLNSSNGSFFATAFGIAEDKPTPADYDGDGKTDISVFRPSTGAWYRLSSVSGFLIGVGFGQLGDIPVAADYNGDGSADIAVFRPTNGFWFLHSFTSGVTAQPFGIGEDRPAPNAFIQ